VISCNVNATSGSQKWVSVVIKYVRALKNDVKIAQTLDRLLASPLTTPSQLEVCSDVMAFLRSNLRHRPGWRLSVMRTASRACSKFMIEHMRETLIATGARVASLGDEDCLKSMQLAGIMIVRLAGFTSPPLFSSQW